MARLLRATVVVVGVFAARGDARSQALRGDAGARCTLRLDVRQTHGAEGCFIDERVTRAPGELRYACGDGEAEAVFGPATFRGAVRGGVASLRLETTFHFSDGCDWRTEQTLDGPIAAAAFTYRYREFPVAGQRGCARPCAAQASVRIVR
jgi:hypothetical protein